MWKFAKYISAVIILYMAILPEARSQVQVKMSADTAEMLIGEQVHLTTTVTARRGSEIVFPSYAQGGQMVPGVEVLETGRIDTLPQGDASRVSLERKYTLTAFDSALYYLPPMEVEVDGKKYAASTGVGLKVNSVPVDTVHIDQFRGPHAVVEDRFTWDFTLWGIGMAVFALIVVAYILLARLSDRKPITKKIVIPPRELPHKRALGEMEKLKGFTDSTREGIKDYYVRLTEVLRSYIGERYVFNAMEMTSSEILETLYEECDETSLRQLREIFQTADLVKFAKHQTLPGDCEHDLKRAVDFVERTKLEPAVLPQPTVKYVEVGARRQLRLRRLMWVALIIIVIAVASGATYISKVLVETFF